MNENAPAGCTNQDTDGGILAKPDDLKVHAYACKEWRSLLHEELAFESVEVGECYDVSDEKTEVFITVKVSVPWADVEE